MPTPDELTDSIQYSTTALSITDLLAHHPDLPRRTAQRWLNDLLVSGTHNCFGRNRVCQGAKKFATPNKAAEIQIPTGKLLLAVVAEVEVFNKNRGITRFECYVMIKSE